MSGNELMEKIVGETYARHAGMSDEEYVKMLGFDCDEEKAVNTAIFNTMVELTKQFLIAKDGFLRAKETLKLVLGDK